MYRSPVMIVMGRCIDVGTSGSSVDKSGGVVVCIFGSRLGVVVAFGLAGADERVISGFLVR